MQFSAVDTKIFDCTTVEEILVYLLETGELRHVCGRFSRPSFGVSTIHLSGEADVGRPGSAHGSTTAEFRFMLESRLSARCI